MTDTNKRDARWTAVVLAASVVISLALLESGVPYEPLSLWIIGVGGVALTGFVVLYGLTVRWWEFWIGRALMVSSIGTAALIDVSLINRVWPMSQGVLEALVLTVVVFMSAGGVLKLLALLVDKVPLWRGRRRRRRD